MKPILLSLVLLFTTGSLYAQHQAEPNTPNKMDRINRCKANYQLLFQGEALTGEGSDPEFIVTFKNLLRANLAIISQIEFAFHENLTLLMLFNVISWLVRTKT